MNNLQLIRYQSDNKQTLGVLFDTNDESFELNTLELDWENNEFKKSCIPPGCYKVIPRTSNKYGKHFHVTGVPNRSLILIHVGNYHRDILGCIIPGIGLSDIDGDGYRDVTSSGKAMDLLLERYPDGFMLEVLFGVV